MVLSCIVYFLCRNCVTDMEKEKTFSGASISSLRWSLSTTTKVCVRYFILKKSWGNYCQFTRIGYVKHVRNPRVGLPVCILWKRLQCRGWWCGRDLSNGGGMFCRRRRLWGLLPASQLYEMGYCLFPHCAEPGCDRIDSQDGNTRQKYMSSNIMYDTLDMSFNIILPNKLIRRSNTAMKVLHWSHSCRRGKRGFS